jgi:hypothetical protein
MNFLRDCLFAFHVRGHLNQIREAENTNREDKRLTVATITDRCHINPNHTRGGRPTNHGRSSEPSGCSGCRKGFCPLAIPGARSPWLCGSTGRFGLTLRVDC